MPDSRLTPQEQLALVRLKLKDPSQVGGTPELTTRLSGSPRLTAAGHGGLAMERPSGGFKPHQQAAADQPAPLPRNASISSGDREDGRNAPEPLPLALLHLPEKFFSEIRGSEGTSSQCESGESTAKQHVPSQAETPFDRSLPATFVAKHSGVTDEPSEEGLGPDHVRPLAVDHAEQSSSPERLISREPTLEDREKKLAEGLQALKADRAVFESELDELDDLKRRESSVTVSESALKKLEEDLNRRAAEVGDLESIRSEFEGRLLAAEADHSKTQAELRAAKQQIEKKSEEVDTLATEVDLLTGKLKGLREQHRILKREHTDLKAQFATAAETLEERTKELDSSRSKVVRLRLERDQLKERLAQIPDLSIRSEALLQWIAQDGTPECIGLDEDSCLGWSGVGSYDSDAFDRLLIQVGIKQYALPHPSISHVVVGREGWSKEDLLEQIDMRQGQSLRVYSQEMLLAALITGRDPLDCEEAEILDGFKRGHTALEFLAESDLGWPSISAFDTTEIEDLGVESFGVTMSPLRELGYKVGETSWLSQKERQKILREAFEMQHLPWVESHEYMAKWGTARSPQRLWRMAHHLAMQLNGPVGRDWRKPQTRTDWLEDLEWLYEKFYGTRRFRFAWPEVSVL